MKFFAVIMAGGDGTRFWPLSRQNIPKQFLNLTGNDILINETITRNLLVIPEKHIYIVAGENHEAAMKTALKIKLPKGNIISEPTGRNTSACIGFAAMIIEKQHGEGVICVVPADHHIKNTEEYCRLLTKAIDCASAMDKLVTLGIKPQYPAVGYGYIRYDNAIGKYNALNVKEFIEKPDKSSAEYFIEDGHYLWNSGIIVSKISVMLANLERFLPRLHSQLKAIIAVMHTASYEEDLKRIYPKLQNISIDCGILERSGDVVVIPGEFGWSDIGSWEALDSIFITDEKGNIAGADHIAIDIKNTLLLGSKLIAAIGLEDMVVVNTEDAVLVCPRNRTQEVRNIVETLKNNHRFEYL